MEKVDVEELDSWMGPADVKRPVGRALGLEHAAMNYYELEPGDAFGFGYHSHDTQEEVFYILDGEVTFETEESDVVVGAGELIRFAPGEWQRGRNEGDDRVRALAIGAPAETETTILRKCDHCGERTEQRIEATEEGDELVTLCVECDAITGRFT